MPKNTFFKPLLILGGVLLLYTAAKAANFINGLKITFQNISFGGSLGNPEIYLTLKVDNPTSTTIKIDNIIGVLKYSGTKIADIESVNGEDIPAEGVMYFDLKAQTTATDALKLIADFINKKAANKFSFDGSLKINGIQVPYSGPLAW